MTDDVFVEISTEDSDLVVTDEDPPVDVVVEDVPIAFDVVVDSDLPFVKVTAENVDIVVSEPVPPVEVVVEDQVTPIVVEGSVGPKGDKGDPGSPFDGTAWWAGQGPPGTIIGSKPGDEYIDTVTGNVYRLGD